MKTEKDDGLEARAKPTPPQENDSKENTKGDHWSRPRKVSTENSREM